MTCIWSLLTLKRLEFLYTSLPTQLMGHSLYQLIHPDEVSLAKRDLDKFIKSRSFGGSITRCRIKNYSYNKSVTLSVEWIIVDIVMYVVSDTTALVFLHQKNESMSSCVELHSVYAPINRKLLKSSLKHSNSTTNQKFYIIENKSKSLLLSWPDHSLSDLDGAPLKLFNKTQTPPTVSCTRCIQPSTRLNAQGDKMDSLVIDYGIITFVLLRSQSLHTSPAIKHDIPPRKQYHPYSPLDSPLISFVEEAHIPYARYTSHPPRSACISKKDHISFEHGNQCQSCGTASSPEWRRGPSGHKTLCNACGLRYSRSVARQGKIAQQQQQQQQQQQKINLHSLLYQSQNTPPPHHNHSTPSSPLSSSSSSTCASTPLFSHDQNYMMNMKYTIPLCSTDTMTRSDYYL